MKKWKYTNPRPKYSYGTFLYVPEDEKTRIEISGYEIIKKPVDGINKTVFQADVKKVNGEEMDKIWTIFNFDNVMELKKKLGLKSKSVTFDVVKKVDEDTLEDSYEIEIVKDKDDQE